jgi:hypothetical protein
MNRTSFLYSASAALLGGCAHRVSSGATLQDLSDNGEPLRSAFNADAQKVRMLMLVSPT